MSRAGQGDALQDTELDVLKKLAVDVENVTVYRNQVFLRVPELTKPGFLWVCLTAINVGVWEGEGSAGCFLPCTLGYFYLFAPEQIF